MLTQVTNSHPNPFSLKERSVRPVWQPDGCQSGSEVSSVMSLQKIVCIFIYFYFLDSPYS